MNQSTAKPNQTKIWTAPRIAVNTESTRRLIGAVCDEPLRGQPSIMPRRRLGTVPRCCVMNQR